MSRTKAPLRTSSHGIRFKQIYFAVNWAHYETDLPGTLRIVPTDRLAKILREDYAQMKKCFRLSPSPATKFFTGSERWKHD